jgi:hypothetical protein
VICFALLQENIRKESERKAHRLKSSFVLFVNGIIDVGLLKMTNKAVAGLKYGASNIIFSE